MTPNDDYRDAIYGGGQYFERNRPHSDLDAAAFRRRFRDVLRSTAENYARFLPESRSAAILDVGCGLGQFLVYLSDQGYSKLTGIDRGSEQVEAARRFAKCDVHQIQDLTTFLESRASSYDLVHMSHVIEHLHKHEVLPVLKAARAALKPGGRIVIQTPNMASISAPFSRYIDFTHEVGFTERSLEQVVCAAGFTKFRALPQIVRLQLRPRRFAFYLLHHAWLAFVRIAMIAERGFEAPRVLSPNLYACASVGD